MCINNFDINLLNEEIEKLIKSPAQYLRYCHREFEKTLEGIDFETANDLHSEFHKMLLNE